MRAGLRSNKICDLRFLNCNYIVLLFLFFSLYGYSQQTSVSARLDTSAMLIGDHVGLTITFSGPVNARVMWPMIPDTLLGNIQVIGRGKIDTTVTGNQQTLQQFLNLTCFDSGFYTIPQIPIKYRISPDTSLLTANSQLLTLMVHTLKVDTTLAIKPIKGPMKVSLTFREILPWLLLGLGIILLLSGVFWYLKKRKKHEPIFQLRPRVKLQPHEMALQEFEKLRIKKLWQNGRVKEYYTELTDILRIYIESRFLVPAMEQTSAEILHALSDHPEIPCGQWHTLGSILMLADMVKFAKAQPSQKENEGSLETAIGFVTDTGTASAKNEELEVMN